jgi:hypothetical protein
MIKHDEAKGWAVGQRFYVVESRPGFPKPLCAAEPGELRAAVFLRVRRGRTDNPPELGDAILDFAYADGKEDQGSQETANGVWCFASFSAGVESILEAIETERLLLDRRRASWIQHAEYQATLKEAR